MKVYFVGSHSIGKTTLARMTAKHYGFPLLAETARQVLAELEPQGGLRGLTADLDALTDYQAQIMEKQIKLEDSIPTDANGRQSFVTDRGFDNLAYMALNGSPSGMSELLHSSSVQKYLATLRDSFVDAQTVFFVRPHKELMIEDGVRHGVNWQEILTVDGIVLGMLSIFQIPYIPISCLKLNDRMRIITSHLDAYIARKKNSNG